MDGAGEDVNDGDNDRGDTVFSSSLEPSSPEPSWDLDTNDATTRPASATRPAEDDVSDDPSTSPSEPSSPEALLEKKKSSSRLLVAARPTENDSEAETERLEATPRKSDQATFIARSRTAESTQAPLLEDEDAVAGLGEERRGSNLLAGASGSQPRTRTGIAGRKRKRVSTDSNGTEGFPEQPAAKRSFAGRSGGQDKLVLGATQTKVVGSVEHGDTARPSAQEEVDKDEVYANAVELIVENAAEEKPFKVRKGAKGAKRKTHGLVEVNGHHLNAGIAEDEGNEGEKDTEDAAAPDEDASKKKAALDELDQIQRNFKAFRQKACEEQMAQCEKESEMLSQLNCIHPEYVAQIQCVDEHYNQQMAQAERMRQYQAEELQRRTAAEWHQIHSQAIQEIREAREAVLSEIGQRMYQLQRDRRQMGMEEGEYVLKFAEKRSRHSQQQTAFNQEVSVLAGVAKHVGFPAAPEMKPVQHADMVEDMRTMKIRANRGAMLLAESSNQVTATDEGAERSTGASTQPLPTQQDSVAPVTRVLSHVYQTPTNQKQVEIQGANGSISTIDINSNPPSSANAQGGLHVDHAPGAAGLDARPVSMKHRMADDGALPGTASASSPHRIRSGAAPLLGHVQPHANARGQSGQEHASRAGGLEMQYLHGATGAHLGGPSLCERPESDRIALPQSHAHSGLIPTGKNGFALQR